MPLHVVSDDPDLAEELPPLGGPEEEVESEIDLTEFVDSFVKDPNLDLDDESAPELDVGISVEEPEDSVLDDRGEIVLDIAELLALAEDEPAAGDELGPTDFEPGEDIEEPSESLAGGDDSTDEVLDGLVSDDELPSLDADDDGDFQLDESWAAVGDARDEPLPAHAPKAWAAQSLIDKEPIAALLVERGLVVAAGSAIHFLGREARRIRPQAPVVSAALSGGLLLYFTAAGKLLRQELGTSEGELLEAWRECAGARGSAAVELELGAGGLEPGVVLAKSSDGRLLRSRDRGTSFAVEDLHARVLSLDARSLPALALVETSAGRSLLAAVDGGSAWRAVALDPVAQQIAAGQTPMVAASGDVVAIADPERGLALSADEGRSFRRVVGAAHASALAIGSLKGAPQLWAALHAETEDLTSIVRIDVASELCEIIAEIGARADPDALDGSRVAALAWDGARQHLLVAGGFGLLALEPPVAPS